MPETIASNDITQIIGGTFSQRDNADRALQAFRGLGVPEQNLQVVVQLDAAEAEDTYANSLTSRGVSGSQAVFYGRAVKNGKTLVIVHNVIDPDPIIDVFDRFSAEYNPDGSRNLREDVLGMTAGAAIGAAAGGVAGTAVAGPLGTAAGAAIGAVVGGGIGSAAGKSSEHKK